MVIFILNNKLNHITMINHTHKRTLNGNKIAIFIIFGIILWIASCEGCRAQSYYKVEVMYQLTDGSDQATQMQQIKEPQYSTVLADLSRYVSPYKVKPYSLYLNIVKVPGIIKMGNGQKFKPEKKRKSYMGYTELLVDSSYNPTLVLKQPPIKHDSTITSPNYKGRLQEFVWIDYPKPGYPFYTVKFKKSSVTFTNDTTFTYVDKFR